MAQVEKRTNECLLRCVCASMWGVFFTACAVFFLCVSRLHWYQANIDGLVLQKSPSGEATKVRSLGKGNGEAETDVRAFVKPRVFYMKWLAVARFD